MENDEIEAFIKLARLKGGVTMLERTAEEMDALGIPVPGATIVPDKTVAAEPDTYVVSNTYRLGDAFTLPDNEIAACGSGCGRTIEHRPGYPEGTRFSCVFCAVERAEFSSRSH